MPTIILIMLKKYKFDCLQRLFAYFVPIAPSRAPVGVCAGAGGSAGE